MSGSASRRDSGAYSSIHSLLRAERPDCIADFAG
jgi:hypothetical protein